MDRLESWSYAEPKLNENGKNRKGIVKCNDLSLSHRQNVLNQVRNGQMRQSAATGLIRNDNSDIPF